MPLILQTLLPSTDTLQRLLDGEPLPEVARDPRVVVQVIDEDGQFRYVLTGDPA